MKEIKFIGQSEWDIKKAQTAGKDLLMREFPLADVKFVKDDVILVDGRHMTISANAYKELTEILKLPKAFLRRFQGSFGEEGKTNFIKTMMDAAALQGGTVYLIGNPVTLTIESILPKAAPISTSAFVDFAESLMSGQNLNPVDFRINGIGNIQINMVSQNPIEAAIDGFKTEVFKSGLSLNLNSKGILVNNYVNRLWCTNGAVGLLDEDNYRLSDISGESIANFMSRIQSMSSRNYMPSGFAERIGEAMKTPASYAELAQAAGICSVQGSSWKDLQTYVPIDQVTNAYARLGYDMDKVTEAVKRKAHTPFSRWQVMNGMTAWGTHTPGLDDSARSKIAVRAGKFMDKDGDLAQDIPNPFARRVEADEPDMGE